MVLNPAPVQKLDESIFPFLKITTPNETEAEILTGVKVIDLDSAEMAANELHKKGIADVIITLGSKGAYFHNAEKQILIPSPKVLPLIRPPKEMFLMEHYVLNQNIEDAITFACRAAAISVTRMRLIHLLPHEKN